MREYEKAISHTSTFNSRVISQRCYPADRLLHKQIILMGTGLSMMLFYEAVLSGKFWHELSRDATRKGAFGMVIDVGRGDCHPVHALRILLFII